MSTTDIIGSYKEFLYTRLYESMPHLKTLSYSIKKGFLTGLHNEDSIDLFAFKHTDTLGVTEEEIIKCLTDLTAENLF